MCGGSATARQFAKHFQQAQGDLADITTSSDKIARRGARLDAMDFEEQAATPAPASARGARWNDMAGGDQPAEPAD